MGALPGSAAADSREVLRSYQRSAPWRLRDLAAVAGSILNRAGVVPVSSAASIRPTERTIRFYVTRGLVNPPDGRGTSATYSYRHLLQVLAIKVRQTEGATLDQLAVELGELPGDALEHRVAAALGSIGIGRQPEPPRLQHPASPSGVIGVGPQAGLPGRAVQRIPLEPGVELSIERSHPAWRDPLRFDDLATRVAAAIAALGRPVEEEEDGSGPRYAAGSGHQT